MKITLRAARVNAGLTQSESARRLGINRMSLLKYEKHPPTCPTRILTKMSELYATPIECFILDES